MTDKPLRNITTCPLLPALHPSPTPASQHFPPSFSLCTLINFQTNLFIVHCCLSEVASTIDPFPPHMTDYALTLKTARNYSSAVFLCFTFAQRRRAQNRSLLRFLYFLRPLPPQSFCTSSCLDLSQGGSWCWGRNRGDLQVRGKVDLLIPKGSPEAGLLYRTALTESILRLYDKMTLHWFLREESSSRTRGDSNGGRAET